MYNQPFEQLTGKDVEWEGWYEQNGQRNPMKFDRMEIGLNGVIEGGGQDIIGQFQIFGQVSHHGSVNFTKQYIGKHAVAYQGVISSSTISGNWTLGGYRGKFEIKGHLDEWQGSYECGGCTRQLKFDLDVDTAGVFGIDKDNVGVYVIRGQYSNTDYIMKFTRQYIGGNTHYFQGNMTNDGRRWILNGQWQFAGCGNDPMKSGRFQLMREAPLDQQFENQQQQQVFMQQHPPVRFLPPPVIIQQAQPIIMMQPGTMPMQMPMQQIQQMQGGGGGQQLFGNIRDFEILDGEKEDIDRVMDLLRRGKKIEGSKLVDFVERITFPEDLTRFVEFVPEYLIDFEDDHLLGCVAECEHPQCKLFIVEKLFSKVEGSFGAIKKSQIANKMHSNDDEEKAKEIMGF